MQYFLLSNTIYFCVLIFYILILPFVKSLPPEGPSSKGFISSGFISRGPGSPPGPPNTPSDPSFCMPDGGSSLTMKYSSEISSENDLNPLPFITQNIIFFLFTWRQAPIYHFLPSSFVSNASRKLSASFVKVLSTCSRKLDRYIIRFTISSF